MTSASSVNNGLSSVSEEQLEAKVGEFLREHSEVEMILPVVIGLTITSRFQLRGAQALLVNLLVASVTRQVLTQLKKPVEVPVTASEPPKPETVPSTTADLGGYAIVHSIPGRVRLKIPQLALDPLFAKRIVNALNEDEYVVNARVNQAAACLVINYEAGDLSDWELGLRLLNVINAAEAEPTPTATSGKKKKGKSSL
jgi:hypothetical protein